MAVAAAGPTRARPRTSAARRGGTPTSTVSPAIATTIGPAASGKARGPLHLVAAAAEGLRLCAVAAGLHRAPAAGAGPREIDEQQSAAVSLALPDAREIRTSEQLDGLLSYGAQKPVGGSAVAQFA